MGKTRVRLNEPKRRVRSEFEPVWEGSVRAWTINYLRKNKWRYDPILELDDLLQDAYLVFMRVAEKYPRVVEAPHFMALYKTALLNELIDAANENTARRGAMCDEADANALVEKMTCNLSEDGAMTLLLASAPPEVRLFLSVFANDDHLLELRRPYRRHRGLPRDSFNSRVKQALGIDSDADLVGCFRRWLTT
jgi:hypothetical protein